MLITNVTGISPKTRKMSKLSYFVPIAKLFASVFFVFTAVSLWLYARDLNQGLLKGKVSEMNT